MNKTTLPIAVICGLIAAVLFLSPMTMGGFGLFLSSFTALPLFVVVLGFGTRAGMISGAVSAFCVAIFLGPIGAISVLGATMAPALWIGHSAGLSRNDDGQEEWFPLSQILFRLTAISAAIVIILGAVSGYSPQFAFEQTSAMIRQMVEAQGSVDGAPLFSDADIATRAADIASLVPFMMPVSILLLMVLNLRLAERFARRRKWILRPREDLPSAVGLPPIACGIFAIAVAASFVSGSLGLVAQVIAGAFGGAFVLVGLATIHFMTRGLAARPFLLPVVYMVVFFSRFIGPVFAVLGVAETLFQLRARSAAGPKST